MGLVARTTDSAGSGSSSPGGSDTSTSGHMNTTGHIVLPIVLIIVILVIATLFGLYCRRVLQRSRISPVRLHLFGHDRRPRLWEVRVGRPEERAVPLRDMRPLSVYHSPPPSPPSTAPSSPRFGDRYRTGVPPALDPHEPHTVVHMIAMPTRPARSRHASSDSLPDGLSFGVLKHS